MNIDARDKERIIVNCKFPSVKTILGYLMMLLLPLSFLAIHYGSNDPTNIIIGIILTVFLLLWIIEKLTFKYKMIFDLRKNEFYIFDESVFLKNTFFKTPAIRGKISDIKKIYFGMISNMGRWYIPRFRSADLLLELKNGDSYIIQTPRSVFIFWLGRGYRRRDWARARIQVPFGKKLAKLINVPFESPAYEKYI